jgi:THO complex subunit 1
MLLTIILKTEWAEKTRKSISSYLTDGQLCGDQEGKYYHRMVETVLSRDKNWVRWKLENCNQIKKPPVYSGDFGSARDGAKKICRTTALKSSPMGALDLKFLTKSQASGGNGTLSETAR